MANPVSLASPEKPTIAVYGVTPVRGVLNDAAAQAVTNTIENAIVGEQRYNVLARRDMDRLREEAGFHLSDECKKSDQFSCYVEIGGAAGAQYIATADVSKIGLQWMLSVKLTDMRTTVIWKSGQGSCEGEADCLIPLAAGITTNLLRESGESGGVVHLGLGKTLGITTFGGIAGEKADDGIVRFESDPPGAKVVVDGRELPGRTPLEEFIPLGKQNVRFFDLPSYNPHEAEVVLSADQTVRASLEPITGEMIVQVRDEEGNLMRGVSIFLDGEDVAKTPVRLKGVQIGERILALRAEGYRGIERAVAVKKDEILTYEERLERAMGQLQIKASLGIKGFEVEELGAESVFLDGKPMESLSQNLPPGSYLVSIRSPSAAQNWEQQIFIADRETKTLEGLLPPTDDWIRNTCSEHEEKWINRYVMAEQSREAHSEEFWWLGGGLLLSGVGTVVGFAGMASAEGRSEKGPFAVLGVLSSIAFTLAGAGMIMISKSVLSLPNPLSEPICAPYRTKETNVEE